MEILVFQPHILVIYLKRLQLEKIGVYDLSLISSKEKEKYYSKNLQETQFIRTHDKI